MESTIQITMHVKIVQVPLKMNYCSKKNSLGTSEVYSEFCWHPSQALQPIENKTYQVHSGDKK